MQEGKCDWAADVETPYEEMAKVPIRLGCRPDCTNMSDVQESPAVKEGLVSGHVCVEDLLGSPHGKHVGKMTEEVARDVYLSARCLFRNGPIVGGDDLDIALNADKGKGLSWLKDEISEMSVNRNSAEEDGVSNVTGRRGEVGSRMCNCHAEAMEKSVGRMEVMLSLLLAVNGSAGPEERLALE